VAWAVFAVVAGALCYSGSRCPRRPARGAQQFHGHNLLELIWTVVPTLMVISFSILSWNKLNLVNDVSGAAMTIQVEARQWSWSYTYPDQDIFRLADGSPLNAGTLDIPVGQKINR